MESGIEQWLRSQQSRPVVAVAAIFFLIADVLLPVPSSIVCTIVGSSLGPFFGTLVSTLGMTSGALLGFGLGRLFGQAVLLRRLKPEERERLDYLVRRWGVPILFLLRPVPLFAEGSLLFLGSTSMSWTVFFLATLPIHFCLAMLYACLGYYIAASWAVLISVLIAMSLSGLAFLLLSLRDQNDIKP